jgi:hypothetical protein
MSFTKAAGTSWCNLGSAELAAQPVDLFLYAIGETGASAGLKFGYSRISWAQTMADFVNTNTNEKYIAGNWTNFNSSDAVTNIGRFRAQLSAGAGYTWSIATANVINRPIYESEWLDWNTVFTGFSVAPSNNYNRYKVVQHGVRWVHRSNTDGTSSGTGFTFTLPFTPKNVLNNNHQAIGNALDNGASVTVACRIGFNYASGNVATVLKDMASATWTAANGKRIGGMQITDMEV